MKNTMNMKTLGILLLAAPISAHAATLTSGYITGTSSKLLTANGGAGAATFVDTARTGGADLNFAAAAAPGFVWSIDGSSLWATGNTVSFTGLALGLFSNSATTATNNTSSGTFTFTLYSGGTNNNWQGTTNLATSGDSLIGSGTASFTGGATETYYVNFDTAINWTADSSLVVVHADSDGAIRFKTGVEDVPKENLGNGDNQTNGHSFSLAGTVVPEPSTALLGALGALVLLRRRR